MSSGSGGKERGGRGGRAATGLKAKKGIQKRVTEASISGVELEVKLSLKSSNCSSFSLSTDHNTLYSCLLVPHRKALRQMSLSPQLSRQEAEF